MPPVNSPIAAALMSASAALPLPEVELLGR